MKKEVEISWLDKGVKKRTPVRAVIIGGLAISHAWDSPSRFKVTHVKSGLAVSGSFTYAIQAYRFTKAILPLADWNKSASKLGTVTLRNKVQKVERSLREKRYRYE